MLALTGTARAQGLPQARPVTAQQMAEYRAKLAVYKAAREQFDSQASSYWASISEKRKARIAKRRAGETIMATDYVLTQPPVYSGPPAPVDPSGVKPPPTPRAPIPVVADFLQNAMAHFQFSPRRPASEIDYKRAYVKVASSFGLTKDQAVRIYGFESGGNGKYDVQAGLESERPGARAISTALGYNQLLTTNTIDLLAEHGALIIKELREKAAVLPASSRTELERKIPVIQRMIAFSRSVPNDWYAHEKLGTTAQGIGLHALNLDLDVGPILQTLKLMDSVNFASRKGYDAPLSAAELEMMNLTGDGNGFDMVSMPQALRLQVPTSNFFQRGGYERNPVAIRNNTVAKLIAATDAKMDKEMTLQGARDLASLFPTRSVDR
ncbi:MAG: hypothetical protein EKK40_08345 [Bradyrhizobiaceae bacterium]|nr:MAG: hypothetical protein EKK40_08345 [Bradyrhizobiaceae bacterium]